MTSQHTAGDELEVRLSKELEHTLKLVPQSQRELFVFELARWYRKDLDTKVLEARIEELGTLPGRRINQDEYLVDTRDITDRIKELQAQKGEK